MHISTKIFVSVLLLASEILCLQIILLSYRNFCYQVTAFFYKFLKSFYGNKLKTTLIDGIVLISCENYFF